MPNSSCQGSINISFVFIVDYARTVTCVGLFFLLVFFSFLNFYLFIFGGCFSVFGQGDAL